MTMLSRNSLSDFRVIFFVTLLLLARQSVQEETENVEGTSSVAADVKSGTKHITRRGGLHAATDVDDVVLMTISLDNEIGRTSTLHGGTPTKISSDSNADSIVTPPSVAKSTTMTEVPSDESEPSIEEKGALASTTAPETKSNITSEGSTTTPESTTTTPETTTTVLEEDQAPASPTSPGTEAIVESELWKSRTTIHYTSFSECYPKCVIGVENYRERFLTCRDHLGIPVPMSECAPTKETWEESYIACEELVCDEKQTIEFTDWDPCPKACTPVKPDGIMVAATSRHNWNCKRTSNTTRKSELDCSPLVGKLGLKETRDCPLKPCTDFEIVPTDWSRCDCDIWIQERENRCKNNTRKKAKEDLQICENFGLQLVETKRDCLPHNCTYPSESGEQLGDYLFNFCPFFNCSAHGVCTDNDCDCEKGYSGHECQWAKGKKTVDCKPPSILERNGTCCESGVYNYTGHCCPGNKTELTLDKHGACCDGILDVCGNCNPKEPEFMDIRGTCCKALDAGGFCCPSGNVDECGVCDGLSLTCNITSSFKLALSGTLRNADECGSALFSNIARVLGIPHSDINMRHFNPRTYTLSASAVSISSGLMLRKISNIAKKKPVKRKCGKIEETKVYRKAVCGNKVCEIGEASSSSRAHCPSDCMYPIARCEHKLGNSGEIVVCSGHGSCSFGEKPKCICFTGYTGSTCEKCQYGYFHPGTVAHLCLPKQALLNGPTFATPIIPSPSPRSPTVKLNETQGPGPTPEAESSSIAEGPQAESSIRSVWDHREPYDFDQLVASSTIAPAGEEEVGSLEFNATTKSIEPEPKSSDDDDDLPDGAIAGIVIGCFVILVAAIAVVVYFVKIRKPPAVTEYSAIAAGPEASA